MQKKGGYCMYLTRAKQQVWLLYNPELPSEFVEELKQLGVPKQKKP